MEENVNNYFDVKISELESANADKTKMIEQASRTLNPYITQLECENEISKNKEKIKEMKEDKEEIKDSISKKKYAEIILEKVARSEEGLLKEKAQCEAEIDKFKDRVQPYNENKPNDLLEYENDLSKIEKELGELTNLKQENNGVLTEMNTKIEKYEIKYNVSISEKGIEEVKKEEAVEEDLEQDDKKQENGVETTEKGQEEETKEQPVDDPIARVSKIFEGVNSGTDKKQEKTVTPSKPKEEQKQEDIMKIDFSKREPTDQEVEEYLKSMPSPEREEKSMVTKEQAEKWWKHPIKALKKWINSIKEKLSKSKGEKTTTKTKSEYKDDLGIVKATNESADKVKQQWREQFHVQGKNNEKQELDSIEDVMKDLNGKDNTETKKDEEDRG